VDPGSEGLMKDCVVDVAIKGSFGDGPKDNLAVGACSVSSLSYEASKDCTRFKSDSTSHRNGFQGCHQCPLVTSV
jgi:hypothetical protein